MQTFTITPSGIKELRKALMTKMIITFSVVAIVAFILPEFLADVPFQNINQTSIFIDLFLICLMGFGVRMSVKRQEKMFGTYKLTITDERITREMDNTAAITILKSEIKQIIKNKNGGIGIVGKSRLNAIGVPTMIENRDTLEQLLNAMHPITVKTSTWVTFLMWPAMFSGIVLMYLTMISHNKIVIASSGILFTSLMIYGFIVVRMSKNVDQQTKRWSFVIFIPLLSVIWMMIEKLIN
jgi:hypothetical protein